MGNFFSSRAVLLAIMFATWMVWHSTGQTQSAVAADAEGDRRVPRKILLDTDPGGDDVVALLWLQSLAKQGVAEIVAVTTVGGNVHERYTFANASKMLTLGGFDSVEVGRSSPLKDASDDASHIHGADGMGNLSHTLPPAKHRLDDARFAHDIIIEKLGAAPGDITLVAVGPLTNLAAAEKKSPGILAKAKEIVVMGGAFRCRGNITSQAEFNIHYDPEAAQTVFAARDDIVVLPLDVTQQITFTTQHAAQISHAEPTSEIGHFLVKLTQFMSKTSMSFRATQGVQGFHVHDAATLAYLFYPETLSLRRAKVRVETQGEWTRGQTLFDDRHGPKPQANAWVALEVDDVNFLAILAEDLKVLMRAE
jgi:inosine-uridine nucleoside N-ribohydrolase